MKVRFLVFALLLSLILTACSGTQPQGMVVIPLVSSGSLSAFNVTVDVAADGLKHIAWSECPEPGDLSQYCRVIYQRMRSGETGIQLVFSSPGVNYRYADVVALDNGSAVVSFYESGTTCKARFAFIPSVVITQPTVVATIPGDGVTSHCGTEPALVTNGSTVYAIVNNYVSADGQGYLYRKLLPSADAGASELVSIDIFLALDRNTNLVARVDASNNLHAAWFFEERIDVVGAPNTRGVEYANNVGLSGNLPSVEVFSTSTNFLFNAMDLAVESPTQAHIVYSIYGPGMFDSELWLGSVTSGVTANSEIPLTPGLGWDSIYASISHYGAGTANQVIVFGAENTDIGNSEIFYKLTNTGGSPVQLSNSISPVFSARVVPFDNYFLAGWRISKNSTCPDEVQYSYFDLGVNTVFQGTDGCPTVWAASSTLSADGPWVAGSWIDQLPGDLNGRLVPWVSFNTNKLSLPLITR